MRITKSGNWVEDYVRYDGSPATCYYRKRDIDNALRHYGHPTEVTPKTELNPYTDASFFVVHNVTPFRVVR